MDKVTEIDNCVGCSACKSICPVGAIQIKKGADGFFISCINQSKCIDCCACVKVCPQNANPRKHFSTSYVFQNRSNLEVLKVSSSGGVFSLLAENILNRNGVVYGVSSNSVRDICHIRVDRIENLWLLRGAKYVQSNIGNIFVKVKNDLDKGIEVLFSGTPCQVAGLKKYLRNSYFNLTCVGIVCHGAPSPKIYNCYLDSIELKYNKKIKSINFRDKRGGWNKYKVVVLLENNKEIVSLGCENEYIRGFVNNLFSMKACSKCRYKLDYTEADITIGDFWGIQSVMPDLRNFEYGFSVVFVSSPRGEKIFSQVKNQNICREVTLEDSTKYNPSAIVSSPSNINREFFFQEVHPSIFKSCVIKYIGSVPKNSLTIRLKSLIYRLYVKVRGLE